MRRRIVARPRIAGGSTSRSDAIVAWEACIDRVNPDVEHVEVRTTHVGLGFAPEVYRIIAERLAGHSDGRGFLAGQKGV